MFALINGKAHMALLSSVAIAGLSLCAMGISKFSGNVNNPSPTMAPEIPATLTPPDASPTSQNPPNGPTTETVRVKPGDNLALIFTRLGLSAQDLQRLVETQPLGPTLKKILPGHEFSFVIGENNDLVSLTYASGPLRKLKFTQSGDRFDGLEVVAEPELVPIYKQGVIDHSLFVASQRAGLDDNITSKLEKIFQWDIDFVLDIRNGDTFHVLFEEQRTDGELVGFGRILAAEFVNQGRAHQAVLYTNQNGEEGYFDPSGKPMRKRFLRAPVEFTRISSYFNLRRKHPLWKHSMPHRGIDYAAPQGTPVRASGSGMVAEAAKAQPNGNYVVLHHGDDIVTKYLHLSRFASGIRPGTRVRQGQVIGFVGATGWATGPHLHYEFLVSGVHQNPRTVALPDAQPIGADESKRFQESTAQWLAALTSHKEQTHLAVGR